jgi:cation:H+ antiporter
MGSDPGLASTFIGLVVGAVGVVFAGVTLARSADVIAARTRIGGLWLGMVLLAFATSLPELVTAGTAARIGAPDLAAGDLFGSNMANMMILALINLLPRAEVFRRAALDQALAATFAITLTSIAAGFVLLGPSPAVGFVGPGSLILLVGYLVGSRAVLRHSAVMQATVVETEITPHQVAVEGGEKPEIPVSMKKAIWHFILGAVIVSVTAPLFAISSESAVELTGLSESFIGVLVLGIATSLPEAVASLAALRIQAYDLAVANLFGSNAVNMLMFMPLDLVYTPSSILGAVGPVHAFTGLASIVMMAIALGAIVLRAKRTFALLEPSSGLIMLIYVVSVAVVMQWGM